MGAIKGESESQAKGSQSGGTWAVTGGPGCGIGADLTGSGKRSRGRSKTKRCVQLQGFGVLDAG